MENQGQGGVEPGEGTIKTQLGNWDQRINGKWMGLTSIYSLPSWLGTSINRTVQWAYMWFESDGIAGSWVGQPGWLGLGGPGGVNAIAGYLSRPVRNAS